MAIAGAAAPRGKYRFCTPVRRASDLVRRLAKAMRAMQVQRAGRMDNAAQHLILLDPKKVLARGYSLVQDTNAAWCPIRDSCQLVLSYTSLCTWLGVG